MGRGCGSNTACDFLPEMLVLGFSFKIAHFKRKSAIFSSILTLTRIQFPSIFES
jgi:hypothetical protein